MISLLLFCARLCLNDFNSVTINSGYLKLFSRQLVETTTTINQTIRQSDFESSTEQILFS